GSRSAGAAFTRGGGRARRGRSAQESERIVVEHRRDVQELRVVCRLGDRDQRVRRRGSRVLPEVTSSDVEVEMTGGVVKNGDVGRKKGDSRRTVARDRLRRAPGDGERPQIAR